MPGKGTCLCLGRVSVRLFGTGGLGRPRVRARARVKVNMRITVRVCISVRFVRGSEFYDLTVAKERGQYVAN